MAALDGSLAQVSEVSRGCPSVISHWPDFKSQPTKTHFFELSLRDPATNNSHQLTSSTEPEQEQTQSIKAKNIEQSKVEGCTKTKKKHKEKEKEKWTQDYK
ncbi:hypothetical protein GR268_44915 [Rhizobium leguminosarum]|nr:hypothetical protein [Rhizobium leguminosarum]